ncbi:unnamed protein product [Didymodactylos carnosus]|uniref:Uncharacterized protein n=1 Tax=Didymodactylos carnosus TaxID=1234261 RepID=A0A815XXJ6_9BILA|nr:unnamed protein product [Didymodactylos carnosus]CAF1562789.1 unnamed protein product [Didymodactylos carnosus]CAF3850167.1 unnamed protein product [Didymodactylos carnosus]CAF4424334.1 unnamed protein product [Didymodactylos carnosus]
MSLAEGTVDEYSTILPKLDYLIHVSIKYARCFNNTDEKNLSHLVKHLFSSKSLKSFSLRDGYCKIRKEDLSDTPSNIKVIDIQLQTLNDLTELVCNVSKLRKLSVGIFNDLFDGDITVLFQCLTDLSLSIYNIESDTSVMNILK